MNTRSSIAGIDLPDHSDRQSYSITDLSEEFGVTARALRFYEVEGLISPERQCLSRIYSRRDRARLALILRSKAIGAPLSEIKQYLDMYGAHGEGRVQQLRFVLERTDKAIAELETKRAHIEASLAELRVINAAVREKLSSK